MSLRIFLLDKAGFNKNQLDNFIKITKEVGIEERFLNERYLEIIALFSELTEITMTDNTKLFKDSSDRFKEYLGEPDNQKLLLAKINALKSETANGYKDPKSAFDSLPKKSTIEYHSKDNNNHIDSSFDINVTHNNNVNLNKLKTKNTKITKETSNKTKDKKSETLEIFDSNNEATNDSIEITQSLESSTNNKSNNLYLKGNSDNKFYYQIHQENLSSIYDCGLICPTKYDSQRTQPDIQEKYRSFLLLSDSEILYNDDSSKQMLLELHLTLDEHPIQLGNDGLFLFDKPLPVSRISRIIYSDKAYAGKLMGLVTSDAISFIPDGIATYKTNTPKKSVTLDSKAGDEKLDFIEKLSIFDKRLGALAYMKNANLYYGVYSNYSDNYFNALHELDSNLFPKYPIDAEISFKKAMNTESISNSGNDIYLDIQINKEYLETKLKEKKYSLDKLPKGPFSICKKDYLKAIEENYKEWFNVAYIAIYGDKSSSSTTSIQLKREFAIEVKNREKADLLLALLGAYYGYKALRPHDQITINSNDTLSKEIDTNTNIKFKMDSQLDYLTIETVYQKTFNNQVADKNFICIFAPKFSGNTQIVDLYNKFNRSKYYKCTKQTVYDVDYVRIIKKDKKTVIVETLNENYNGEISQRKSLFSWIYSFFLDKKVLRISPDGIYVNKEDLITEIEKCEEKNFEKLNLEWFDELVNLDIKYKR